MRGQKAAWAACFLLAYAQILSPENSGSFSQRLLTQGHQLYYAGRPQEALAAYEKSLRSDPKLLDAWRSGSVIWQESGKWDLAAQWLKKAVQLAPQDADTHVALGEAELQLGHPQTAREELAQALALNPKNPYALLAQGRVEFQQGRVGAALEFIRNAAAQAPKLTLTHYWLGKVRESVGDLDGAAQAYKKAVEEDSYFAHARHKLETISQRTQLSSKSKGAEYKTYRAAREIPLNGPWHSNANRTHRAQTRTPLLTHYVKGKIPVLRVGIGTTAMGKPLPRKSISFLCKTRFDVLDSSGRQLLRGAANEFWEIRMAHKARLIEVCAGEKKLRLRTERALRIRPDVKQGGTMTLREMAASGASTNLQRHLRGEVEISLYPGRRALKVVNIVDLESYTHGVLAAEMPIHSPIEALKAQAVVARSHALYIKTVTQRHFKDGYDLCDGQHCQVYSGVRIESERSRSIVEATRGRVAAYRGRIAHVLYSSNCGGHTQSGREVQGWGDLPYWTGIPDAAHLPVPRSPWDMRLWLRGTPPVFCRPSSYVHSSHFRWTRVVPAEDMERQLHRSLKIGKLLEIRTLKRSISGHLNSVLIRGSLASHLITHEIRIRSLLGLGSQRSALFLLETERDINGKPMTFTFYGGGWGHGVGMCQSGAMGRAEQGYSYGDILKAYYPGTELGNLRY